MTTREIPFRGRTRVISYDGGAHADKRVAQGGDFLIPKAQWCDISEIKGNDLTVLNHPLMEQAYTRILETHTRGHRIAFFSLCTATRPYSQSRKWKAYVKEFEQFCDLIIVSNGGVIPIEYECEFPYLNYDAHGESKYNKEYIEKGVERLKRFINKHPYEFLLFNHRHTLRNVKIAEVVGPWAKQNGLCRDFIILPTKEQYSTSQGEGFADAGFKMYPELWPTMFDPVLEQLKKWSNHE